MRLVYKAQSLCPSPGGVMGGIRARVWLDPFNHTILNQCCGHSRCQPALTMRLDGFHADLDAEILHRSPRHTQNTLLFHDAVPLSTAGKYLSTKTRVDLRLDPLQQ